MLDADINISTIMRNDAEDAKVLSFRMAISYREGRRLMRARMMLPSLARARRVTSMIE